MAKLKKLLKKVWHEEDTRGLSHPYVVAGKGTLHNDAFTSYTTGFSYIQLARHQRNSLVLLHELTHCLGFHTHGRRFVKRYFDLLVKYLGYEMGELTLLASLFKIKV